MTNHRKKLFENFFILSVLQAANFFTILSVFIYGLVVVLFARFRQDWLLNAFAFIIVPGNIFSSSGSPGEQRMASRIQQAS